MIICILILLFSLFLLVISISKLKQASSIQIKRAEEQNILNTQLENSKVELESIKNNLDELSKVKFDLYTEIAKKQQELEDSFSSQRLKLEYEMQNAAAAYADLLERDYISAENKYKNGIDILNAEKIKTEDELRKIKDTLTAASAAMLREKQKEDQLNFYRIKLADSESKDIEKINNFKPQLINSRILSMYVWSNFFKKEFDSLCERLQADGACGIYKIENIKTKQVYIGQSVNIKRRWSEHIKCGLGIDTPSNNKLYKAMLETNPSDFTFEIIERCSRDELDEKERFWINMYKADTIGYNSNKGVYK